MQPDLVLCRLSPLIVMIVVPAVQSMGIQSAQPVNQMSATVKATRSIGRKRVNRRQIAPVVGQLPVPPLGNASGQPLPSNNSTQNDNDMIASPERCSLRAHVMELTTGALILAEKMSSSTARPCAEQAHVHNRSHKQVKTVRNWAVLMEGKASERTLTE